MSTYYEEDLDIYLDNELGKVALTKRGQPRRRKPKEPRIYFTSDTEEAIIEYLASNDQVFRDKTYKDRIEYAFYKLSENIIHTFKFYYTDSDTIEELKHEVITFLLEKLHLYDQSKGKAFSYFGTIAKRYLIVYNEKNYKLMEGYDENLCLEDAIKIIGNKYIVRTGKYGPYITFEGKFYKIPKEYDISKMTDDDYKAIIHKDL